MRITTELLRSRSRGPVHSQEVLDLSNLQIEGLERLHSCAKLRILNLKNNLIDYVSENIEGCSQLWKLDLSNNKIKNLEGLSRFVAIGTFILSNNELQWSELAKIRHMHILDLSLHGNRDLEKDPYYRIHVIDCLPNVWMLDGRIVTSAERLKVQQFFDTSALSEHPVRHKLRPEKFTPSSKQKLQVDGVYGRKTTELMRQFSINGPFNVETDRRRLDYLASNLQEELLLEARYTKAKYPSLHKKNSFMIELLEGRKKERLQCNMLLLLLVASLEFAIPTHLMQEVLDCTKLNVLGNVQTMGLFLLPRDLRVSIVSILLSAVKIDKDIGEEGGLYDKLYLSLYNSVSKLTKLSQTTAKVSRKPTKLEGDYKSLLASEVVQLMCIVPTFFEYIVKDAGIMNLTMVATCDVTMIDKVDKLFKKMEKEQWDKKKQYECVAELVLNSIQENAFNVLNKEKYSAKKNFNIEDYVLKTHNALPRRPQSSPLYTSEYLAVGQHSPDKFSERIKSSRIYCSQQNKYAKLGDKILLGPQNIGRVINIPEPDILLVQMDVVPAESGAMITNSRKNPDEHYTYIDVRQLTWDESAKYWRPSGTVGDRITMQIDESARAGGISFSESLAVPGSPHKMKETMLEQSSPRKLENPVQVPTVYAQLKDQLNLKLEINIDVLEDTNKVNNKVISKPQKIVTELPSNKNTIKDEEKGGTETAKKERGRKVSIDLSQGSDDEDEVLYHQFMEIESKTAHRNSLESPQELQKQMQKNTNQDESTSGGKIAKENLNEITIQEHEMNTKNSEAYSMQTQNNDTPRTNSEEMRLAASDFVQSVITSATNSIVESTFDKSPQVITPRTQVNVNVPSYESTENNVSMNVKDKTDDKAILNSHDEKRHKNQHVIQGQQNPSIPLDSRRIIVAADERSYRSPYASARAEAWKKSPSKLGNSAQVELPPPQRPCSPSSKINLNFDAYEYGGNRRQATSVIGSHSTVIRRGDSWLAGGRDLHFEKMKHRPKSAHIPGWMEGLPQRPKSSAAARALMRTRPPNIITPSSIAYDNAVIRSQFGLAYPSSWRDYGNNNLISLQRPNRRPGILCEKCELKFRREEERWRKLVADCETDAATNPPPSPSNISCDHDKMDMGEYVSTTHLTKSDNNQRTGSALKQLNLNFTY